MRKCIVDTDATSATSAVRAKCASIRKCRDRRADAGIAAISEVMKIFVSHVVAQLSRALRSDIEPVASSAAREDELAGRLQELRARPQAPPALHDQLQQAQGKLAAHGEFIGSKLSALDDYTARVDAALQWAAATAAALDAAAALPPDQRQARLDAIALQDAGNGCELNHAACRDPLR
uniref:Uncharacterized protein n=1 Tax=Heliothis virescens TaxID=7102 RepID=A0A2A4JDU1_HELVI